jgi:alpha-1,3-mannosylglycoprotein beta-1,4-N-acetylglucosaminyltransferase A/B
MFSDVLQLPSIYHFLPHLLSSADSLKPSFRISKSVRNSVTMVFGVPTVKREVESYLVSTLHNLIDNLSVDEKLEACIVVFIAEVFVLTLAYILIN